MVPKSKPKKRIKIIDSDSSGDEENAEKVDIKDLKSGKGIDVKKDKIEEEENAKKEDSGDEKENGKEVENKDKDLKGAAGKRGQKLSPKGGLASFFGKYFYLAARIQIYK